MKRFFRYIICFAMLSSTSIMGGCKRQHICNLDWQTNSAKISFLVDWSTSNIDIDNIYNMSIYAYADGEDSPYVRISGDIYTPYINLSDGLYSIILFNDFVGDLKGVTFLDSDNFDQFRAEIIERSSVEDLYYQPQSDEVLAQEIGELAIWRAEGVEVSQQDDSCSLCSQVDDLVNEITFEVDPMAVTTQCIVKLAIDNLDNAAYIEATIKGLAYGVYLSTESRFISPDITTIYTLELNSRTYNSDSDGVAQGEITTFGKIAEIDQSYEVVINITLNSGELVTFTRDVTTQLLDQDNTEILIDLTSEADVISLPVSSSGGFGVESWGDNEKINVF